MKFLQGFEKSDHQNKRENPDDRNAYVRSTVYAIPRKIARPGSRVLVREAAVSDEEGALEAGGVVTRRAAGKRPSETHVCYQPGLAEPYSVALLTRTT